MNAVAAIVPPPPRRAEPLWRKWAVAFVLATAGLVAGAIWTASTEWWGGLATQADIHQAVAAVEVLVKANTETATAALNVATRVQSAIDMLAKRTQELEDERTRHLHEITELESERVGLRVALHVGLDPKRKKFADAASSGARAVFDDQLLREPAAADAAARVHRVAERVLQARGVPR